MQISSRFSVAVHIISLLKLYGDPMLTSDYIAGSVNTNPVVIRRILGMLKTSGFVSINRGNGGAYLIKNVEDITMLDVYRSVSNIEENKLFKIHKNTNFDCPVGANIEETVTQTFISVQNTMEEHLSKITLADVINNLSTNIEKNKKRKE